MPGADAGRRQLARLDLAEHRYEPATLRQLAGSLPGQFVLGRAVEIWSADMLDDDLVASEGVRLHLADTIGDPMIDCLSDRGRLSLVGVAVGHDLGGEVVAAGLGGLQCLVELLATIARDRLSVVQYIAELFHDLA